MSTADYANLSNLLMDVAIVGYSVAMFVFAMEALTARVGGGAKKQAAAPEKVLVGSGGAVEPATDADADADAEDTAPEPPAGPGARSVFLGRFAVTVMTIAWLGHLAEIVTRGLAVDRWPWGNMYEFTSTICFAVVTAFLVLLTRQNVRFLGMYLMVLVVLGLGLNGALLYKSAGPLVPALHSYWIAIHVTAATLAIGLYALGAVTSVLYLFAERHSAKVARGLPTGADGLLRRLPGPETLDKLSYRVTAVAFPIWTFALVAGAIWAESAWGRYWGWDPKETWTFIIWVIYAGYLHARVTAGWRGRRAAVIALLGFASILVNYFVVNIWVVGLHSYA